MLASKACLDRAVGTSQAVASPEGMLDFPNDRARLALADYYVAEGERRITRQKACLECCRAAGHDTQQPERRLSELEGDLASWQEHRAEILRTTRPA